MNPLHSNSVAQAPRVVWLDVVRLVAFLMLIMCHCTDPFNFCPDTPPNISQIKFWGALWGAAVRPCVPLFVMITGALLLPVKTDAFLFYKKRILRVLSPFLIWSVLYALFPWILGVFGYEPKTILVFFPYSGEEALHQELFVSAHYIARIPLNFHAIAVHMWYIYILIGLYLYLPIFSAWVERASWQAKGWFLAAWAVTLFVPYMREFVQADLWGICSWNEFGMLYYFAGFNGYLLLGHALRNIKLPSFSRAMLFCTPAYLLGFAVCFFGFRSITARESYSDAQLELFFYYCSAPVAIMSAAVFLVCRYINPLNPLIQRSLKNLTTCGFGIFMAHYFLSGPSVQIMRDLGIPVTLQVPLAAISCLIVTWIFIDLIRRMGPWTRYITG